MCGIIGYIGKQKALSIGLEGLKRLEYRGYDSAGAAFFDSKNKNIRAVKAVGRISNLEEKLEPIKNVGTCAIFHTRWSTHGEPNKKNAHPHWDCAKNIFLVHNGIIENYETLKRALIKKGHRFVSDTDTEVLAHLIEESRIMNHESRMKLEEVVKQSLKQVRGTYGIAVISKDEPNKIVAARNSSPLLIGVGSGEYFVASDSSAILGHTKKIVYLEDGDIATITPDGFQIANLGQKDIIRKPKELEWNIEESKKGGYSHFMLKEIFEEPFVLENTLRGRLILKDGLAKLGGLESAEKKLRNIDKIVISACGTAYYAGLVGEYMLEEYAGIPAEVELASEFRYRKPIIDKKTCFVTISQSGETADSLAALREAKRKGALTLGIVNVVGSAISREIDAGVYSHAGPEIGVASTKAFISQLGVLALLTLFLGRQRNMSLVMGQRIARELNELPKKIKEILKQAPAIKKLAKKYKKYNNFLYLGRKYNFPVALEGALKLKEISYIHAEGYGAGEMKHGPIALIDKNFPSIFIAPRDSVYEKMVSNIEEIKARKGPIIVLTTKGNKKIRTLADDIIYIPKTLEMLTPVLSVVPLQLFAYYAGVLRGFDVDKPRNLAKSVTVE